MRQLWALALAVTSAVLVPGSTRATPDRIAALAPLEIVAGGRDTLVGVAADAEGAVYVSDRGSGHVYRLAADGALTVVARDLDRPAGLAFDLEGRLLIAEERAGRILRLGPGSTLSVLVSGIRSPRWIAVAPSGALYVSAHRLVSPDGPDVEEGREIVLVPPGGESVVVASGIRRLEGLVVRDDAVIAATKGLETAPDDAGALLRFPLLAEGALGPAERWLGTGVHRPVGLAEDVLGALYVSSHMLTDIPERARRAIGKIHRDMRLSGFAENLTDPQGVALGPDGALYVADGRSGRLLRFAAPPAPILEPVPPAVAAPSVELRGMAVPNARMDVVTGQGRPLAGTVADAVGAFAVAVPLEEHRVNELYVLATAHGGDGLTGHPAVVEIAHDAEPPALAILEPPVGAFLRQTVTVRVRAADAGSGVASLTLLFRGQTLAAATNPDPASPVTPTVLLDTAAHPDGTHTLAAVAEDRAGNPAATSRTVTVDNTPPDTEITGGPSGTVAAGPLTFTFTGSDSLTPASSLTYAWRLDSGPWSPFTAATSATVDGLAQGEHLFQVRARDLAGNDDPTPASRAFMVAGGIRIAISAPVEAEVVPAGPLLVRGTVDSGGDVVGVTVNGEPAAVHGDTFAVVVSAEPGPLVLSAVATSVSGATAQDSVAVTVAGAGPPLSDLRVSPSSGIAPLVATFSLAGLPAGTITLDADGDGLADFTGPALPAYAHTYARPGLYVAQATVRDGDGRIVAARHATVEVLDRAAAGGFFRARWTAFRDALARADIEAALTVVAEGRRQKYRGALQALVPDLAAIVGGLGDLTVLSFGERVVEGIVTRVRDGVTHLHFVYFMRDDDGIWKIAEM